MFLSKRLDHRQKKPRLAKISGFTLIEIIAVVAIIAILAALLVPTAQKSLDAVKRGKCASNLRQIGMACLSYVNDHEGQLPPSVAIGANSPVSDDLISVILKDYIPYPSGKNDSVWFCPAAQSPRGWGNTQFDYSPNERESQFVTGGVLARQGWGTYVPALRLVSLSAPARVMLFVDTFENSNVQDGASNVRLCILGSSGTYFGSSLPTVGLAPRHGFNGNPVKGKFNAVFCDGHVEAFDWNDARLKDASFRTQLVTP